jgi:hypothetical protein
VAVSDYETHPSVQCPQCGEFLIRELPDGVWHCEFTRDHYESQLEWEEHERDTLHLWRNR